MFQKLSENSHLKIIRLHWVRGRTSIITWVGHIYAGGWKKQKHVPLRQHLLTLCVAVNAMSHLQRVRCIYPQSLPLLYYSCCYFRHNRLTSMLHHTINCIVFKCRCALLSLFVYQQVLLTGPTGPPTPLLANFLALNVCGVCVRVFLLTNNS